ncbi:pilus assembly protein [Roseateles sp. SL47]|uniref:TfpX/TfpZ family type IV pilin accessory protein n=1 Tax=Roseateles sp. SL47 TaxID=2995138 RepID=UPI00226E4FCF|nr:TfpX/TfpZ family type IV pilin accessory protein [Roseateles sp. SL47]WAC74311.1 pilus assembly protein [Roseateles sp. SL47]
MNWRLRLRASGLHLLGSLLVALAAASVVLLVWYPWPYRVVAGGQELLFILLTVDIIIGPLLTLAVFNLKKPKKELRRDLAIIVVLQLLALGYGMHTVYLARPAVIALEVDRFRVTTANDVVTTELPEALPEYRSLSMTGPVLVNTAMPSEAQRFDAIILGLNGVDLGARPSFWRPWDEHARSLTLKNGRPLVDWLKQHPDQEAKVREAAARSGRPVEQLLFLPMLAHRIDWSVLVDKSTGDLVGFAPIDT